jgi:FlaA1/EpsC-like NDP-sugar epimerase/UDP-N-acetylmuramyl pentapeptide phosphotransferase/UDP-N-acetylglucosamine-1-phosphate transferase
VNATVWVLGCLGGIITWLTLFPVRAWLIRSKVIDVPNERSSHRLPTPRGGGLIFVAVILACWVIFGTITSTASTIAVATYAVTAGLIAAVSWADDIRSQPAWLRLGVHSLGAALAIATFGFWDTINVPRLGDISLGWLGLPVTFVWIVGLTNAFNFMDGIDGIAGSQALVAGLGWATLGWLSEVPPVTVLGLLVAACSLGFLMHNWSPARIFMGDVGSAFLGHTFALLPLMMRFFSQNAIASHRALFLAVLMVWPFVIDANLTIIRRLLMGQNIFLAHRTHLYQRMVAAGFSHRSVTLFYAALALLGMALAVGWSLGVPGCEASLPVILLLLGFGLLGYVVVQERHIPLLSGRNAWIGKTLLDISTLASVYCLAFVIRFEGRIPAGMTGLMRKSLPFVIGVKLASMAACGLRRMAWRYVGLLEAKQIVLSLWLASSFLIALRLTCVHFTEAFSVARYGTIPLGVLLIDLLLTLIGILGLRVVIRLWTESQECQRNKGMDRKPLPTILVGSGRAEALLAKAIASRADSGIVGIVNDDPQFEGMVIHGCPVLGRVDELEKIVWKSGAKQALITIPDAPGRHIRHIVDLCHQNGIAVKIIPELLDTLEGKVNLARPRDVMIEDLLRRDPVRMDHEAIAGVVCGQRVLITGAGGSIGSELCRKVCQFEPSSLMLLEQSEHNLFSIHGELHQFFPRVKLLPCVADICDIARIHDIFGQYRPSLVFHAASYKHVPMMEWNPREAVKNNVFGTKIVADMAHRYGCGAFVMISTDKAVRPTSVMGATKHVAELYVHALSQRSKTRFVTVRFGNVLGSNGSVVPIFKQQISNGGPVTVTHPDMERYFMTISEACELVLQAASMYPEGELFILDMGAPVKIVDLARDLIRLSGLIPDQDIEIKFTGMRAGEKLHEELSMPNESLNKTLHPRIFSGRLRNQDLAKLENQLEELRDVAVQEEVLRLRSKLKEIVPEYQWFDERQGEAGVVPGPQAKAA